MRLTGFSILNYRSVQRRTSFELGDLTTLVGANNEGKSNILRAVALGMKLMQRWSTLPERYGDGNVLSGVAAGSIFGRSMIRPRRRGEDLTYRWEDDYPINKQQKTGTLPTQFRLTFSLSVDEMRDFQNETGISSNGNLPIEIELSRNRATFKVVKPGKGHATHQAKAKTIASFITSRLTYVMVPAVRTMTQAQSLMKDLTQIRIRQLTESEEYRQLSERLAALRHQAIDGLGGELSRSIQTYLPTVSSIQVISSDIELADSIDDVLVDDGTITSLSNKGDGIKSLVTLALLQELARQRAASHSFLLLVDEPEAHLHPKAVHELQALFGEISADQQVVLATHNPIFVNRDQAHSNLIVDKQSVKPARTMKEIRETIGVRLQDNLDSAETVILVEGLTDSTILRSIIAVKESQKNDIKSGRVVFKHTAGTSKMRSHISREKSTVCRILVVLDNDNAGRLEAKFIADKSLLDSRNVFMVSAPGAKEAEIEDWFEPSTYLPALNKAFGRTFKEDFFRDKKVKWSMKFLRAAQDCGIAVEEKITLEKAKHAIAESVAEGSSVKLNRGSCENLEQLRSLIWPVSL